MLQNFSCACSCLSFPLEHHFISQSSSSHHVIPFERYFKKRLIVTEMPSALLILDQIRETEVQKSPGHRGEVTVTVVVSWCSPFLSLIPPTSRVSGLWKTSHWHHLKQDVTFWLRMTIYHHKNAFILHGDSQVILRSSGACIVQPNAWDPVCMSGFNSCW